MTAADIFLQIAGFALQTVPVAMLMCVPFGDGALRYSRKKAYLILMIPVIAASVGFAFAEPAMLGNGNLNQLANMFMMLFIVIEFGIYFFLVRSNILSRLLVMIILIHYAAVLFTCSNILIRMPYQEKEEVRFVYGTSSVLSFLTVTAVTFPLVCIFMRRVVRQAISIADNKAMKRGFIYLISALLMYCAAYAFIDFNFDRDIYKSTESIVFFTAFAATDFVMYYMFFFETKLVTENSRLMSRIQSFDEQYRRITREIEESRRLKHDMRHHLNAISTMHRNGETKELTKYLEAYSSVYSELDSISSCGYHAVDNTLRYYIISGLRRKKA